MDARDLAMEWSFELSRSMFALAAVAVVAVFARVVKTIRQTPRKAVRLAAVVELGFLIGAVFQSVFAGAYLLGGITGLVLSMMSLDGIREASRGRLMRAADEAPDPAGALLVLHDRRDYLVDRMRAARTPWGLVGDALLLLGGITAVGLGLSAASATLLVGGTVCLFAPLNQVARHVIQSNERWEVERLIKDRLEGTAAPKS